MKILIFLFAVITFMLMAGDPRREDFESKEFEVKKNDQQQIEQKVDQKDSAESS
ncbi:ABZJ_00068 family colistin stress protein [Acinetobacter bereziniae]|uniref:ABZJ_00068 family colistin stress protein n=1 Tax=Acinetobacter bereziniae TaxID=106648 RepID=UPI00374EE875